MDTVEANLHLGFGMDERDYGVGAQILRYLGATKLKLMSNNPRKRAGLKGYGLEIVDIVPIEVNPNSHNLKYLETKRDKLGHEILGSIFFHAKSQIFFSRTRPLSSGERVHLKKLPVMMIRLILLVLLVCFNDRFYEFMTNHIFFC
jgi:hypothetical protein